MTDNSLDAAKGDLVDEIGLHMAAAGGIDRAAVPLGLFVAWLVNLDLVSRDFVRQHESAILRLKYRELSGSELLVGACAGRLCWGDLNARGCAFVEAFYPSYPETFAATFEAHIDPHVRSAANSELQSDADIEIGAAYLVADNWDNYDRISRVLTAQLMGGRPDEQQRRTGKPKSAPGKKWWSLW